MKYLAMLKSLEALPYELPKLPKAPYGSKDSTEGSHSPDKVIPFNILSQLFLEVLAGADWQEGMIQAPQMQEAEDNLERAWREAEEGSIPLKVFKEALGEWERVAKEAS
jgi:hypothetical protein